MQLIAHRRNTIAELKNTPARYGVEIDIRSIGKRLVLQHEPYEDGEDFEAWIAHYQHRALILNVKEEGLEAQAIQLMQQHKIANYFFLDQSFPFLVRWSKAGEHRAAVRVSEYESPDTALALAGKVDWVWVDCFTKFPLSHADAARLQAAGFKLCLASPELHGRNAEQEIPALRQLLSERAITPDAACSKRMDLWESNL